MYYRTFQRSMRRSLRAVGCCSESPRTKLHVSHGTIMITNIINQQRRLARASRDVGNNRKNYLSPNGAVIVRQGRCSMRYKQVTESNAAIMDWRNRFPRQSELTTILVYFCSAKVEGYENILGYKSHNCEQSFACITPVDKLFCPFTRNNYKGPIESIMSDWNECILFQYSGFSTYKNNTLKNNC